MATKTISIDLEAYDALVQARRLPGESFSKVIKRAHWKERGGKNGAALLAAMRVGKPSTAEQLEHFDRAQREDLPPKKKWKRISASTRRSS
jgi:predicted CopG family antitoxin